jgi:hypothetical protein
MQIADAWLQVNDLGSNVQIRNITPAEAVVLRKIHGIKVVGQAKPTNPFTHLHVHTKTVERSADAEYGRLIKKFGAPVIESVFPGENPTLPKDFESLNLSDKPLPAEPEHGPVQVVTDLMSLKPDNGRDLEAPSKVEALEEQVAKLTALVEKLSAPKAEHKK